MRAIRLAERNLCWRSAALAGVLLAVCAGCAEERARRALEEALAESAAAKQAEDAELRARLQAIVRRWPGTRAASRARRELEWLDDLANASARGPELRAWDAVRRVARAAERFREDHGRYPRRFEELVPRYLHGPVVDPWGHRIRYERHGGGYRVVCYGADGLPGGVGVSSDLVAANGESVAVGGKAP
ncbi:MAG: hypothetical protein D6718_03980 [Acidobacteria bacterium]|nr:MAG: hypothetical protein D6718_03980 [Acidobacteriota bacterium]